ncbi:hypothetical protein [Rhodopila globiformis]|uniref:hypothetical protein n=1 Tax=Rhodopila globiformis TaxID=1071 RepID=UPI001EFCC245|nr:hypothetical protein [Rhodopila globiformis]
MLLLTGYAGAAPEDTDLPPGMEVLHKPFAFDQLTARVRALTEGMDVKASA